MYFVGIGKGHDFSVALCRRCRQSRALVLSVQSLTGLGS